MDIASVSLGLMGSDTMSRVDVAVLDKAMDSDEAMAKGLLQMMDAAAMERSVNPAVGANFDVRV